MNLTLRVPLFFILFFLLIASSNNLLAKPGDVTHIPDQIKTLFPTATRIEAPLTDIPVIPVYQLNQLLGYVFESINFAPFMGFSGEPVNVLIGLDTTGVITGLKVLKHNEPIFVHGLGEKPMHEFVQQYENHSIRERFILNANSKTADATYFDGVTKATVSVLVINDTIVTSALKVARAKLDGFVAPSNKIINPAASIPTSFDDLLEQGFIYHWQINYADTQTLADDVRQAIDKLERHQEFVDIYLVYISVPEIGRTLLGEKEFERLQENLKPGEHALLAISKGDYSYISEEFIPQTVPPRLLISQNDFPVAIRDVDFYDFYSPEFALPLPEYDDLKVFRLKSQSGFDLAMPVQLSLGIDYQKSFMDVRQHYFNTEYQLPNQLFMDNPRLQETKPIPLWQKIWLGKQAVIVITVTYLLLLTALFIYQTHIVKQTTITHLIRFTSLLFVLGFIGFYAQGQLSVVNIYTLLLSIYDGFSLDIFLLDPILFILWSYVFVSLFLFGRGLYCGWLCPFGALQEFAGMLAKRLKIKQLKISQNWHSRLQKIKYLILFVLVGTAFYSMSLAEKLAEIEPFKTSITLHFARTWPFVVYAVGLILLSMKINKVYCRYLCPLGAGLAIVGRYPVFKWLRRRQECGNPCQLCRSKKCDIDAINQDGSIDYRECVQCLECVVTIENPTICKIDKYKAKSLRVKQVT